MDISPYGSPGHVGPATAAYLETLRTGSMEADPSVLLRFSARFSLMDLAGFFASLLRGDLSDMWCRPSRGHQLAPCRGEGTPMSTIACFGGRWAGPRRRSPAPVCDSSSISAEHPMLPGVEGHRYPRCPRTGRKRGIHPTRYHRNGHLDMFLEELALCHRPISGLGTGHPDRDLLSHGPPSPRRALTSRPRRSPCRCAATGISATLLTISRGRRGPSTSDRPSPSRGSLGPGYHSSLTHGA